MSPEVTSSLIGFAGVIAAAVVAWILSRPARKIDESAMTSRIRDDLLNQVQEERDALLAERIEMRAERAELRGEMKAARTDMQLARSEAEGLRLQMDACKHEMRTAVRQVSILQAQVNHLDTEVVDLRKGIANGTIPPLPERPAWSGHS